MSAPRTDARPFEVEIGLTVKTYDVDFSGVVSQLTYHRWLEELWVAMLTRHDALRYQVDAGRVPVVSRTTLHARRPVGLGASVQARMWLGEVGRCRWRLAAEFAVGGDAVAAAEQTGCFVDLETRRPLPLPEEVRPRAPRACADRLGAGTTVVPARVVEPGRLRMLLRARGALDP
jgi:acyl-CoA thioester hydrolase